MPVAESEDMGKTMSTAEVPEPKEQKVSPFRRLLARFQIRPHASLKRSTQKSKKKDDLKSPKPPLQISKENAFPNTTDEDVKKSEWTEASLQVPENLPTKQKLKIDIPVPPPRKNKIRNQDSVESIEAVHLSVNLQSSSPQPVTEPIIIAQKVIEHVCDGSHHHVHNVVNGKVIDEDIKLKSTATNDKQPQNMTLSSISLPSAMDLKKKEEKQKPERVNQSKNKSSASSLPNDKKTKVSSAAEKIESYIKRWKSVSSFRTHNKTKEEKPKPVETEQDKNSEYSWNELDDWDLGVIENDIHTYGSDAKQQAGKITSTPNRRKDEKVKTSKVNTKDMDRFISYVENDFSKNRVSMMTDISSDTCNDFSEPRDMPELTLTQEKICTKPLTTTRPFEKDAQITSEFLKQETMASSKLLNSKHLKLAPLATFDSDRDINKLLNTEHSVVKKDNPQSCEKAVSLSHILDMKSNKQKDGKVPIKMPRKKTIGHSSLLKFMTEANIKSNDNTSETQEQTRPEIKRKVANKKNEEDTESPEPKIVPEIRTLEASWQELVQRDEDGQLSSLLELESAVSDSLNSSEDTKSTIIDGGIKCT